MRGKWLGHASFIITAETGAKIIADTYVTTKNLNYSEIKKSADIITTSHGHGDHSNVSAVRGSPKAVRGTARGKGIEFKGIPTYHDDAKVASQLCDRLSLR